MAMIGENDGACEKRQEWKNCGVIEAKFIGFRRITLSAVLFTLIFICRGLRLTPTQCSQVWNIPNSHAVDKTILEHQNAGQ